MVRCDSSVVKETENGVSGRLLTNSYSGLGNNIFLCVIIINIL